MYRVLFALTLLLALAACSSPGSDNQANETAATEQPKAENVVEAAAVSFSGTLGCGHCTHHIGDSCSAAVEASDGTVYILEGIAAGTDLFDKRFDGGKVKVEGKVATRDGVHYVTVVSYEMM